jgi:hypothetical protein
MQSDAMPPPRDYSSMWERRDDNTRDEMRRPTSLKRPLATENLFRTASQEWTMRDAHGDSYHRDPYRRDDDRSRSPKRFKDGDDYQRPDQYPESWLKLKRNPLISGIHGQRPVSPGPNVKKLFVGNLRIFLTSQSVCPWKAFPTSPNVCG